MLIAIAAGLLTAAAFTGTAMATRHSSRVIGGPSTIAWLMLADLVGCAAAIAVTRPPVPAEVQLGWLVIAGVSFVVAGLFAAAAFKRGGLAIVQSIVSTEGAVTAGLAIIAGESVGALVGAAIVLIAVGAVCAAYSQDPDGSPRTTPYSSVASACAAALGFGVSLYATGRVSSHVSVWVAAAGPPVAATILLAVPLAVSRHLRFERRLTLALAGGGLLQCASIVTFAVGARHSIAVTGIVAGQSGMMAALAGFIWFSERLSRLQLAGIAAIGLGIAMVSAASL